MLCLSTVHIRYPSQEDLRKTTCINSCGCVAFERIDEHTRHSDCMLILLAIIGLRNNDARDFNVTFYVPIRPRDQENVANVASGGRD